MVRSLLLISFFIAGIFPPLLAQDRIELDPIVEEGRAQQIPVAVTSGDAALLGLAQRAVSLNGGYRLVSATEARFTFNLKPQGPNGVMIEILSGLPARILESAPFNRATRSASVASAMDYAVARTLGIPGFFSGRVAFTKRVGGSREIFQGDLLFQEVRQVTNHRSDSVFPRWRPDGGAIVYTSYFRSGFADLFMAQLADGKIDSIASFRGTNTGGVFNPNGSLMALILAADGAPELFVGNAEGENLRRLTRNSSLEATPTWSPDGTRIAFAGDPRGRPQIFVINVSGGQPRRLPTDISGYCAEPAWNPRNPNEIAFTANMGGTFRTTLYDLSTRQSRVISRGADDVVEPAWLADGRHLIVTVRKGGTHGLHVLDSVTGQLTPLHSSAFGETAQAAYLAP